MTFQNLHVEEKSSISRILKKSSGTYSFRIEGYSGLSSKVGDSTESPEFSLCDTLWQLRLFPGGSLDEHRNFVSYYIASKSTQSTKASYKLSICSQVSGGVDECFSSAGIRLFEAKGSQIDGWGRDKFISTTKLQSPHCGFLVNDSVVFKLEITVYGELQPDSSYAARYYTGNLTLPSLGSNLKNMLIRGELSDITLVVGTKRLAAHRFILSARSPVFRAMLNNMMSERETGIIEISDVEPGVMEECLMFMYSDNCTDASVMSVMAAGLLAAACKYQMSSLFAVCEAHLCGTICDTSAVEMLLLSDMYGCAELKESVMKHIAGNIEGVQMSEGFEALEGGLLEEVMSVIERAVLRNKSYRGPEVPRRGVGPDGVSVCGIM